MRWKRFAYAGLLPPLLAGCHDSCFTARDLVNEHRTVRNEEAITRELRKDARCAWREVRSQFPRRMFSEEFRDGFLDGYTDYLDRGGDASPPLVPPARYTRNKKYFTPEGQCLLKDYFLGFKYGTDVAVATGCRQFLTVPVLLPMKENCCPPAGGPVVSEPVQPVVVSPLMTVDPRGANPVTFPLAKPRPLPATKAAPPTDPGNIESGQKFTIPPPPPENRPLPGELPLPDRAIDSDVNIPVPVPSLPLPAPPTRSDVPTSDDVLPAAFEESKFRPNVAPAIYRLPEPPVEVPVLPDGVPTPSVLDDLPMIPQLPK